jgi:hypothetical protein
MNHTISVSLSIFIIMLSATHESLEIFYGLGVKNNEM